ncbi:MAG: PKD domain-containing protein, partial [Bacteroidia bacterium]
MKRTLLLWLMALPFMWMTAQTGTITVSGTVVDQSGQAIPNFPILTGVLPIFANPTVVTTDALGAYTVTLQVDTVVGTPVFFAYNNCIDPQHSDVYVLAADTTLSFNGCVGTGGGSCSAAFSGNAQSLSSLTVDFQAFFTGYNRYEWIFGDGNTDLGTNSNVTHTYAAAGTYTILLTIEDTANACVDTVAQTITLLGTGGGCNAQFSTFPSGPGSYNFFPVVNDPSLAYFWDFDDGNTSTQSTPIHTYSSNGTYNVCLIISDFTAGCSDTFCISLTVGITPPCNINFYAFQSQNNNLQANFFPNDTSFATYAWDFGDGNTSSAVHPVHTYAALGTYNVCLTVSDGANCTVTQCDSVRIDTIPTGACDASFGYSQGFWPLSVDFALLNQSGPAGFILTTWDYGDGTVTQSGPYSNHTYAQAGTYTVCAVVIDPFYNCTDSFCQTVTVTNQGGNNCSAFFFQSYDFTDPNNVHFCVIDSTYATYSWDFGDGGSSTMPNPSHRYSSNGNYTACLAIDDGNGCVDTFCTQVFIGSFTPCIADFSAVPDTNPLTVNFSAIFPDPAITYSWDFGDGNSATGLNPTHTYASTGSYTVTLSITDSVNCNNSSSQTISTAPIPPTNNLLLGQVLVNGIPATDITVYLIQYDSLAGTLTAIDTFSSNGILGFSGLFFLQAPVGDYLVKASLNASDHDYANYLPTYYGDSLAWTGALTVNAA